MTTLEEISETHDWSRGNELWTCRNCRCSPISAHIWGDDEWTASAMTCKEMSRDNQKERW